MGRSRIIILLTSDQTMQLGQMLAHRLQKDSIVALYGDLGAGKTTFVQGLAKGLGINDAIQSPTFIYVNEYQGKVPLFHFDLYRMKSAEDFLSLGFDEYFFAGGVCAIEWPQRIASILPLECITIEFIYREKGRVVKIQGPTDWAFWEDLNCFTAVEGMV